MTTKTTTRRRAFDWKKWGYDTYAANARHLMRMAEIADTIPAEEREEFDWVAREVYQALEGALVDRNGELPRSADRKIDAIFPAYTKCLLIK